MADDTRRRPRVRSRWGVTVRFIGWCAVYLAGISQYERHYENLRPVIVHRMQIRPAAALIQWTMDSGSPIRISEDSVQARGIEIRILRGCDGWEAWWLLSTALVFLGLSIKRLLLGLCIGSLLIFTLNLMRIVTLFHLAVRRPEWMDIAHSLIWQSAMVLFAGGFILFFAERARPANHSLDGT